MGYSIELRDEDFSIKVDKLPEAFEHAKKKLLDEMSVKGESGYYEYGKLVKSYSWVSKSDLESTNNIVDLIYVFGWNCTLDDEGITTLLLENEKMGQELLLFQALAPFVDEGSYIEIQGECGDVWRWIFKDGECIEKQGKITFE